jgi:hypothetical protein
MSTAEAVMTTQEVADRFNELAQTSQWDRYRMNYLQKNAVSIEPSQSLRGCNLAEGMPAIKEKGKKFNEIMEKCTQPIARRLWSEAIFSA